MVDQPLMRTLQCNFCQAYHLDHIYNQTLELNSLSMKMVQLCFEKFFSGQAGKFMVDEIEICCKQIIDNYINHEGKIF